MSIKERAELLKIPEMAEAAMEDPHEEIYVVRAQVRSRFRALTERSKFLAWVFGECHLPPFTSENIEDDEIEYLSTLATKLCKHGVYEDFASASLYVADSRNLEDISDDQMQREEKARYFAEKVRRYLQAGDLVSVVELIESLPLAFARNDEDIRFFALSVESPVFDYLLDHLYERRGTDFIQAYIELGTVLPLEDFDTMNVQKELLQDKHFQKELRVYLAKLIDLHPSVYFQVRRLLEGLGILDTHELESSEEIRDVVHRMIILSASIDMTVYENMRTLFDKTGLMSSDNADSSEVLYKGIVEQLARFMKFSPRLYNKMKNRWVKAGYIHPDWVDEHELIQKALDEFLVQRIEDHPQLYQHFRRTVAHYGVQPFDEARMRRTLASKNESLKESRWSNYSNEEISRFMNIHWSRGERFLQKHEEIVEAKLDAMDEKLQEFSQKFPQLMKGEKSMLGKILS